jgi:murein DD-endopeptidase MepM/ murein hydrolase activator NlpD/transcriptional regulator with XRE-family HTH domain
VNNLGNKIEELRKAKGWTQEKLAQESGVRPRRKIYLVTTIVSLVLILGLLTWFMTVPFEEEKPSIKVEPLPEFLTGTKKFALTASDMKRGLRLLKVTLNQKGRELVLFEEKFPSEGLFFREGLKRFDRGFSINPQELKLAQGSVDLKVRVWDYSKRNAGEGNLSIFQHKMVVDTIPPSIRAVTRMNYVNVGGTGLVLYESSSDAIESGLFVDSLFFKGFPVKEKTQDGYYICYFAIPHDVKAGPKLFMMAKDTVGNQSKASFNCRIRKKQFRTEKSKITDQFLKRILPYFSSYQYDLEGSDIQKFLKINRDLRKENRLTLLNLRRETSSEQLWEGAFLRHENATTTARFADRRAYYYKGKKIDEQVHLGVDLASFTNSKVLAANNGRVIFADRHGIYGLTIVLDHGQGIASTYSHLSKKVVEVGQVVKKGAFIGVTGHTGLATGDHLHYGMMVGGVLVNPVEWWDPHWIQDNITRKLAVLSR